MSMNFDSPIEIGFCGAQPDAELPSAADLDAVAEEERVRAATASAVPVGERDGEFEEVIDLPPYGEISKELEMEGKEREKQLGKGCGALFFCLLEKREMQLRAALASKPSPAPEGIADLQHGMNCGAWKDPQGNDCGDPCTCGLKWHIQTATEETMHAAWRKRAEEAEAELTTLRSSSARIEEETLRIIGVPQDDELTKPETCEYCDGIGEIVTLDRRQLPCPNCIHRERQEQIERQRASFLALLPMSPEKELTEAEDMGGGA